MDSPAQDPSLVPKNRAFTTTQWSVVISAAQNSSPDSKRALESLCESYWYPLYAYVSRRVPDTHEAHDLTQAFFADLLENNIVDAATPERGRFRAFLLTAFKNFLSKHWEKARAQKRGGGRSPLAFDFESADSRLRIDPEGGLTAEQLYERKWTVIILELVLKRLQEEFRESGKADQFEELKGFLIGDHQGCTYADVAGRQKTTAAAAKMAVSRMRTRYRQLLREEIAQTISEPDQIDDEIRNLFGSLSL